METNKRQNLIDTFMNVMKRRRQTFMKTTKWITSNWNRDLFRGKFYARHCLKKFSEIEAIVNRNKLLKECTILFIETD